MAFSNFVSPHVHIDSLDSASTPKQFLAREKELGTGAITVTDHGTLQACRVVYDLARKNSMIPILGLEGYFRDDNCPILLANGVTPQHPLKRDETPDESKPKTLAHWAKYLHFTCHFLDQAAFETGIRLLSKAPIEKHGSETKPLFNWADMEELGAQNVTFGSGCLIGMVQRHLLQNSDPYMAAKYYEKFRSIVKPGNFYAEVFPHVCSKKWEAGVFVTVNTGDGLREWRYHAKKKVQTNVGEIEVRNLAKAYAKVDNQHTHLVAIKNWSKWEDVLGGPVKIHAVVQREGFILNDCTSWAPDGDPQRACNEFIIRMAQQHGDQILISDDSHFASREEHEIQDLRLSQSSGGGLRFANSYHRMSSNEAYAYFNPKFGIDPKTFESWIANSYEWRDKFKDFSLHHEVSLPKKFYPSDTLQHLQGLIEHHSRMNWNDPVRVERLREEISLFRDNGTVDLLPYFFLAEESCRAYEEAGKLSGPGRGSAAGCQLAYLLGVTHIDPIPYKLSLERFLTRDRIDSGAYPDFDLDFGNRDFFTAEDGWLFKRFGDHCAQISTSTLLRLKNTARDVARFRMKSVPPAMDALIRKFKEAPQGVNDKDFVFGYEDSGEDKPGSIESDTALQEYVRMWPDHWETVKKALGLARSKGRHPSAMVIADRPISEFIPITMISGHRCTAFTMEAVEASGGVKGDYLTVSALEDIEQAIRLVQERSGIEIPQNSFLGGLRVPKVRCIPHAGQLLDVWNLPNDQEVFNDIVTGKTETVFQFNTSAATKWMKHFDHLRPDGTPVISRLEDLAIFTALDRPGPLDMEVLSGSGSGNKHNLLIEYTARVRGLAGSPEILPVFNELLPETHGIMCFQEQLQYMFQQLTGCTLSEAEYFRRKVAKKKMEEILALYPGFIEKAGAKIGKENAEASWEFMKTWANYGFGLAHSICYSAIGYACAFLKHHFPLEWWTAVLSNATKEEVNIKFWSHAGHLIDLPDVTKSGPKFEIRGTRIQAPVGLLKGIGDGAHGELLANMPYSNIRDFCEKIQAHKESGATIVIKEKVKKARTKKNRKTGVVTLIQPETVERVEVKHLGGSALASKTNLLIVSGAMDSLFPPDTLVSEMLQEYARTMEDVEALAAGKENKHKAKVPEKYRQISAIDRLLMRKEVLPAYSEDLLPLVACFFEDRGGYLYHKDLLVVDAKEFIRIENYVGAVQTVGVVGYVEDVRDWEYEREGRTMEARALHLDLGNLRREFIRWPNRDTGKLPSDFKALKAKGSVVIATLSRYRGDRPFTLESIEVVKDLVLDAEESEMPEGPIEEAAIE